MERESERKLEREGETYARGPHDVDVHLFTGSLAPFNQHIDIYVVIVMMLV